MTVRHAGGADDERAVRAITCLLWPGGCLFSLSSRPDASAERAEGGPPRLSRHALVAAFVRAGGLQLLSLSPSRFDADPADPIERAAPCWTAHLRKPSRRALAETAVAAARAPRVSGAAREPAVWDGATAELGLPCSPGASADALAAALAARFGHMPRARVVRADIRTHALDASRTALVTPTNTACCMGGGFDAAVAARLGWSTGWPESASPNPLQRAVGSGAQEGGGGWECAACLPVGQAVAVAVQPALEAGVPAAACDAACALDGCVAKRHGLRWLVAAPPMALPAAPLVLRCLRCASSAHRASSAPPSGRAGEA